MIVSTKKLMRRKKGDVRFELLVGMMIVLCESEDISISWHH